MLLEFLISAALWAQPVLPPGFVEIKDGPLFRLDLRYATVNNFTGQNLYGNFRSCYLRRDASARLETAARLLAAKRPGFRLRLFDCLRPRSVQRILWQKVAGTPHEAYVADPRSGSIHNYGFAVDLTVEDDQGRELDMGTGFDAFEPLSEPSRESEMRKTGRLSEKALGNRLLLRSVMTEAGFRQLPNEWWHFDAIDPLLVRRNFTIVE